jgi:hypothetical protein
MIIRWFGPEFCHMNEPIKHHFVPSFYLANWCEGDGMVPWFMRGADGAIYEGRGKPDQIAFEKRLYSYERVPEEQRQAVEKRFFSAEVDNRAAPILSKLLDGGVDDLIAEERIYWTRFLIAARLRVPELVNDLKKTAAQELRRSLTEDHDEFLAVRGTVETPTLLDWTEQTFIGLTDNFGMMILPDLITDPEHNQIIESMFWWIGDVSGASVTLLTSDRPLWVSTGLKKPNCLLALPLSPTRIFFASRNRDLQVALQQSGPNRLARRCNESLASQADRFVYGRAQSRFISRCLNR